MSIRARDSYLLISKFGFLTRVDLRHPYFTTLSIQSGDGVSSSTGIG